MVKIKIGSTWQGGHKKFTVVALQEHDSKTWIYYKNIQDQKEYSCYLEAFLSRFTGLPE
jgi:hypothetical protein